MYKIDLIYKEYNVQKSGFVITGESNNRIANEKDIEVNFSRSKTYHGIFIENTTEFEFIKSAKNYIQTVFDDYQNKLSKNNVLQIVLSVEETTGNEKRLITLFNGVAEWTKFEFELDRVKVGFVEDSRAVDLFNNQNIEFAHNVKANKRLYRVDPTKILQADLPVIYSTNVSKPVDLFNLVDYNDTNTYQTIDVKLDDKSKYDDRPLKNFFSDNLKMKTGGKGGNVTYYMNENKTLQFNFNFDRNSGIGYYTQQISFKIIAENNTTKLKQTLFEQTKNVSVSSVSFDVRNIQFDIPNNTDFQIKFQLRNSVYDTSQGSVIEKHVGSTALDKVNDQDKTIDLETYSYILAGNGVIAYGDKDTHQRFFIAPKRDTYHFKSNFKIQAGYYISMSGDTGDTKLDYTEHSVNIRLLIKRANTLIRTILVYSTGGTIQCTTRDQNDVRNGGSFYSAMTKTKCEAPYKKNSDKVTRSDGATNVAIDQYITLNAGEVICVQVHQKSKFKGIWTGGLRGSARMHYKYVNAVGESSKVDILDSNDIQTLKPVTPENIFKNITGLTITNNFEFTSKYPLTNLDIVTSTNSDVVKSFNRNFNIKLSNNLSRHTIFNHTELTNVAGMTNAFLSTNNINLKFKNYFSDLSKLFSLGVRQNGNDIEFCMLDEIYNKTVPIIDIGQAYTLERSVNSIFKIKHYKAGFKALINWEYGQYEYNEINEYSSELMSDEIFDLSLQKLRIDVSFFNRTQMQRILNTLVSGEKEESKDTFLLASNYNGSPYSDQTIKPFYDVSNNWNERAGLPINVCLSNNYQFQNWRKYIASTLTRTNKILRTSNVGNTSISHDTSSTATRLTPQIFNIANLKNDDNYFKIYQYKIKINASPSLINHIKNNKSNRFRFTYNGKIYYGWIDSVSISPLVNSEQEIILTQAYV